MNNIIISKEDDLKQLIHSSIQESKTLDYKKELKVSTDKEKREFLADVSSFANTEGGVLIYGISEVEGLPKEICGFDVNNKDAELLKINSLLRDGISPRLPIQPDAQWIELENGKHVLVININHSWLFPHRITFKGCDKFYARHSNGKYPMDVGELKTAFNLSESIERKIRNFLEERISVIFSNETVISRESGKIALHIVPVSSFGTRTSYDLLSIIENLRQMHTIIASGWSHRFNLEGVMTFSEGDQNKIDSYVQFFRNGVIEAVDARLLRPRREGELKIPSVAYEKCLIDALNCYLNTLRKIDIKPPYYIFVSLIRAKGYSLALGSEYRIWDDENHPINDQIVHLPEVFVDSYDISAEEILKVPFDMIWNACGFSCSVNYDKENKWVGSRR